MTAEQKIKLNEYRLQILEGREKQPMADYVGTGIANKRKTDYNYSEYRKQRVMENLVDYAVTLTYNDIEAESLL